MGEKVIFLFVGPKGSGKTYLGQALEAKLSIPYIPVEEIWLELSQEGTPPGPEFNREGLHRIYARISQELQKRHQISLDSTGTAPWFNPFLNNLKNMANLRLIRISSPMQLCEERVLNRDQTRQLPVTTDQLMLINDLANKVDLPWDLELYNLASTSVDELVEQVRKHFF